jgi:threonine dehydratase
VRQTCENSLNLFEKVVQEYNMKINKKTKVLVYGMEKRVANVHLKREGLEQVESFTCLGSTITWDGISTSGIKHRITKAETASTATSSLFEEHNTGNKERAREKICMGSGTRQI